MYIDDRKTTRNATSRLEVYVDYERSQNFFSQRKGALSGHDHALLELSPFAFWCGIKRSSRIGNGPRHHLANTDRSMATATGRLVISRLAV